MKNLTKTVGVVVFILPSGNNAVPHSVHATLKQNPCGARRDVSYAAQYVAMSQAIDCGTGAFDPEIAHAIASRWQHECGPCLYSFDDRTYNSTALFPVPTLHWKLEGSFREEESGNESPCMRGNCPGLLPGSGAHFSQGSGTLLLGTAEALGLKMVSFTVTAWINLADLTNSVILGSVPNSGNDDLAPSPERLSLGVRANGRLSMSFRESSVCTSSATEAEVVTTNRFVHVAYQYDYTVQETRIFLNAGLVARCTGRLALQNPAEVQLGTFNGDVRDLQIYKGIVLSEAQIRDRVDGAGQKALASWKFRDGYCWQKHHPGDVSTCTGFNGQDEVAQSSASTQVLLGAYNYSAALTPVVTNISRVDGTTAGGTSVELTGRSFGTNATTFLQNVQCATTLSKVGEYRGRDLCEWGRVQRESGKSDIAVDCSGMMANDTVIRCVTNPWTVLDGLTPAVEVLNTANGRAKGSFLLIPSSPLFPALPLCPSIRAFPSIPFFFLLFLPVHLR
jgi:hypothetical protein